MQHAADHWIRGVDPRNELRQHSKPCIQADAGEASLKHCIDVWLVPVPEPHVEQVQQILLDGRTPALAAQRDCAEEALCSSAGGLN